MEWVVLVVGGLLIGMTLGLTGSGGSILTVPVLVYLVGHEDKVAISESLAIVGGIALATLFPYARAGEIHWRSVIFFGLPGMLGTYVGAKLNTLLDGPVLLIIFGVIVLLSSGLMLRKHKPKPSEVSGGFPGDDADLHPAHHHPLWQMVAEGIVVGVITGLVGVGGGFLIVPALVLLGGLSMRLAVGTSLAIISLNAFSGFVNHLGALRDHMTDASSTITWGTLVTTIVLFTLIGIVGSNVGRAISTRIDQHRLRRGFAVFLLVMGIVILSRETYKQFASGTEPSPATPPAAHWHAVPPADSVSLVRFTHFVCCTKGSSR